MSLKDHQIDVFTGAVQFKNSEQQEIWDRETSKTWFRQYAKKSKTALRKLSAKLKKGIKQGKYNTSAGPSSEEPQGIILPKVKKSKSKPTKKKSQKKISELVKQKKQGSNKKAKITRKQREQIKQIVRRAPSGRVYSSVEIHEGVGSKRAIEYRRSHGIKENDFRSRGK